MGYDFDIEYKSGIFNGLADALSRVNRVSRNALFSEFHPQLVLWEVVRRAYSNHQDTLALIDSVTKDPGQYPNFALREGLLLFRGRIWIPTNSALQPLLIAEFHLTPTSGYASVQITLARLASMFYWPDIRSSVRNFISKCLICQAVKPINRPPQGLLQPLPIPGKIWHSVSMDYFTGLPPSGGKTAIMVVVDRLSKQGHFSALGANFTAPQVVEHMARDVIKLHEPPAQIVSDRDPIFMSNFWRELFKLQGTMLATSNAYHPQIDDQTEILNRYLEDYLRCFTANQPCQWVKYLPWAEWHYNTSWHSPIKMTSYEAVFGQAPPSLQDYLVGASSVAAVDDILTNRTKLLTALLENLKPAQARICNQANTK